MIRPYIYARVSTALQDATMQIEECRDLCRRRGWADPTVWEDVVSGACKSRAAFDEMMRHVRKGHCDVVVVYRFDRFARSTVQLVNAVEEFSARKVDFVSVHEQIDTSTPQGRFAFTVFAAVAEFERALIRERVKSGVDRARRAGKRLGRPKVLTAAVVAQARHLRREGHTYAAISRRLGISKGTAVAAAGERSKIPLENATGKLLMRHVIIRASGGGQKRGVL